jgi:Ornithine/acetylornithine aminotransferase
VSSHLLPTYARVDLAFERGEGAWLYTAKGERYLDFTSGVPSMRSGTRIPTWSRP